MARLVVLVAAAALLVLLAVVPKAEAVTCNVNELQVCRPAFEGEPNPTPECCTKLKEQEPCLCGYLNDPTLKKYWSSPKAKTVADACGVPYPSQC